MCFDIVVDIWEEGEDWDTPRVGGGSFGCHVVESFEDLLWQSSSYVLGIISVRGPICGCGGKSQFVSGRLSLRRGMSDLSILGPFCLVSRIKPDW